MSPVKGQKKGQPQWVNTIGQATLQPLVLSSASRLLINADASHGTVRVEILDEDGYRLRGFTKDDAISITENGLGMDARWKEKRIQDLPDGRYQIRIHLDRADLFAVSIQ